MDNAEFVAPSTLEPLNNHWYDSGCAPAASTDNVIELPASSVSLVGCDNRKGNMMHFPEVPAA